MSGDVAISALATATAVVLVGYGAFETWALATHHRPITSYIRAGIRAWPAAAFVVALLIGLVLGHLFWR